MLKGLVVRFQLPAESLNSHEFSYRLEEAGFLRALQD